MCVIAGTGLGRYTSSGSTTDSQRGDSARHGRARRRDPDGAVPPIQDVLSGVVVKLACSRRSWGAAQVLDLGVAKLILAEVDGTVIDRHGLLLTQIRVAAYGSREGQLHCGTTGVLQVAGEDLIPSGVDHGHIGIEAERMRDRPGGGRAGLAVGVTQGLRPASASR